MMITVFVHVCDISVFAVRCCLMWRAFAVGISSSVESDSQSSKLNYFSLFVAFNIRVTTRRPLCGALHSRFFSDGSKWSCFGFPVTWHSDQFPCLIKVFPQFQMCTLVPCSCCSSTLSSASSTWQLVLRVRGGKWVPLDDGCM